jgi:genome maintenance exonuclease 1
MTFNHVKIPELDFDLESVTTESGRTYKTPTGECYPSITTVLSAYNKQAIMEWRNRVGDEEANRVSRAASGRGTRLHNAVENYLLNEMSDLKINSIMPDAKELFIQIRPLLDEHVGTIYGIEQPLFSNRLKVAGRCDCIGEWEGKLAIIDWKTAKVNKSKSNIVNYFMQAAAYAEMFHERTGKVIDDLVIAIANDTGTPQVFKEKRADYLAELHKYLDRYHNK